MSVRDEARRLHEKGYDLIPLTGKRPAVRGDWVAAPRLTLPELRRKIRESTNLGVRLGHKLPDGRFLACVDVDVAAELTQEEEQELKDVLSTVVSGANAPKVATGSGNGSAHIYLATHRPAKTRSLGKASRIVSYYKGGSHKRGPVWTVELRGLGAQVVLPPSIHPDTQEPYRWANGHQLDDAEFLPGIKVEGAKAAKPAKPTKGSVKPGSVEMPRISGYYRTLIETGDTGNYQSRSEALYAVISVLTRDTDLTDQQIEALLLAHPLGAKASERPSGWLSAQAEKLRERRGSFATAIDELKDDAGLDQVKRVLKQAGKAGLSPVEREEVLQAAKRKTKLSKGVLEAEMAGSADPATRPRLATGDPVYDEVVRRHALVSWAGKPAVFRERLDAPSWEGRYDIMTLDSLKTFYENKPITVGSKLVNPVEVWRADPNRREFLEGARLAPPGEVCPQGVFNLWQGFAVEPVEGDVSEWLQFTKDVICGGSAVYHAWLEDWIADMFQNVGNPKGCAVVMRGEEGVGKGTFANALGHLMGGHYRHVTQESQLTGRFNGHFADSTLIFADELIWGGDKKHRGTLYAMVTEKYLMVERKNFDAVPFRNLNRMVIASNNDWVVPTGMDGRRWFVLDVSSVRKGNARYFTKLGKALADGGYGALLHHYLHKKIKSNLRVAPITRALLDQKEAGFDTVTAWWAAVLERGCVRPPVGDATSTWEDRVSKELLRNSYQSHCKDYGMKPAYHSTMMKRLHKLTPWLREVRGREGEKRVPLVELPTHEECQEEFQRILGTPD